MRAPTVPKPGGGDQEEALSAPGGVQLQEAPDVSSDRRQTDVALPGTPVPGKRLRRGTSQVVKSEAEEPSEVREVESRRQVRLAFVEAEPGEESLRRQSSAEDSEDDSDAEHDSDAEFGSEDEGATIEMLESWAGQKRTLHLNNVAKNVARLGQRSPGGPLGSRSSLRAGMTTELGGIPTDGQSALSKFLHSFVTKPTCTKRVGWELFGLVLIIYDLIWLP
ncbi:unnamed protein product, partial [Polarella glacialis]